MRFFVGGLPFQTSDTELAELFGRFAEVTSATVVRDRDSGRSKGFGFVEIMRDDEGAAVESALNGSDVGGRRISVDIARPRGENGEGDRSSELPDSWDESLRRLEEAPQQSESTGEFRELLDVTLHGTPTDELFRDDAREDLPRDDTPIPAALIETRFVDDGLIDWLAKHPKDLYALTPRRFEELCAGLLDRMGFQEVRLTPESQDGGVDIYALRHDLTGSALYLIQCKRWAPWNHVGRPELQKLWGIFHDNDANKAILATTSYFARPALAWQSDKPNRLELRDFDGVRAWLDACRSGSVPGHGPT